IRLWRVGLSSVARGGDEATGAAAELSKLPVERSYFELIERMCTLDALRSTREVYELRTLQDRSVAEIPRAKLFPESDEPARWRYARSNGVALHVDWTRACEHAFWELVERDRILRAWCGELAPQCVPLSLRSTPLGAAQSYEWSAHTFPCRPDDEFGSG